MLASNWRSSISSVLRWSGPQGNWERPVMRLTCGGASKRDSPRKHRRRRHAARTSALGWATACAKSSAPFAPGRTVSFRRFDPWAALRIWRCCGSRCEPGPGREWVNGRDGACRGRRSSKRACTTASAPRCCWKSIVGPLQPPGVPARTMPSSRGSLYWTDARHHADRGSDGRRGRSDGDACAYR